MEAMREAALEQIAAAADQRQLQELRVRYLGRKGELTAQLKLLGQMAPEQRREAGARINALRDELEAAFLNRRQELEQQELNERLAAERVDLTLPGMSFHTGGEHLLTRVTNRLLDRSEERRVGKEGRSRRLHEE